MTFRYGLVIGMDYLPPLRLMLIAPSIMSQNWDALVLHDEPHDDDEDMGAWEPGQIVSVSPLTSGLTIIESDPAGDTE